jgi:uncharacterized protein (DUF302 family)
MKDPKPLALTLLTFILAGCSTPPPAAKTGGRHAGTDELYEEIVKNASEFEKIVTIDHSRLAEKEGVTMPPAVVYIYSDPKRNTALLKHNIRVGVDLPSKILVYEELGQLAVGYATPEFLSQRHGITDKEALSSYQDALDKGLRGIDKQTLSPVTTNGGSSDYGIIEIVSEYPFQESIDRLKEIIMKQGDTVWFGSIDFQAEATPEKLPPATLLLFGGPKPGGVAMADYPKLGLDAFCQKVLVYEQAGKVNVIFNDIAAMAEYHYGKSAEPHTLLNQRLTQTFKSAVHLNP